MRTLKLMPEYDSYPLWDVTEELSLNIDPRMLPISPLLSEAIMNWADRFQQTLNQVYPPESGFEDPQAAKEFRREGERLAEQLADELGEEYSVTYQPP